MAHQNALPLLDSVAEPELPLLPVSLWDLDNYRPYYLFEYARAWNDACRWYRNISEHLRLSDKKGFIENLKKLNPEEKHIAMDATTLRREFDRDGRKMQFAVAQYRFRY